MCNFKRLVQTVSSNGKFRIFLVRILIRKYYTDNKVFKKEFHTKETRKEEIKKDKVLQILVQFAGTYLRERVWKTEFFEFEYFSFFFSFVEKFQFSFNFESFLKFFSAEFSVEFSFSYLTW